jgi:hypothetical protein
MPRKRKISIEDAFNALHQEYAKVVALPPAPDVEIYEQGVDINADQPKRVSPTMQDITLYCQHSIGIGQQYGPGRVRVPSDIAAALLHQDQVSRAVDARVFDTKQHMYQIMPFRSSDGSTHLRGMPVDDLDFTRLFYGADAASSHFKF